MKKTKKYENTKFGTEIIKDAIALARELDVPEKNEPSSERLYCRVDSGDSTWRHDSIDEFFADYRKCNSIANISVSFEKISVEVDFLYSDTTVEVAAPSRQKIEKVFNLFEANSEKSKLPETKKEIKGPKKIFIGHGHSILWRDLKDHLHEKHGYEVEAYEIGTRAGHAIRDILEKMLNNSSIAFLVMTGEDRMVDDRVNPRLNVVHEAGLFQGRIGFNRAIILLEDGTESFSNIQGIQYIPFSKGRITETFGDVLATIKREFA